jgi:hypothetical protein
MPDILDYIIRMKIDYENAITAGGEPAVKSLIRSQKLINLLHEYVKDELIAQGIDPAKIYPPQGQSKPELDIVGLLKKKSQDISILPVLPSVDVSGIVAVGDGVLEGENEHINKTTLKSSISINVRSQLSSLGNNFDTLYERTFAEALNLHLRTPELILGEIYLTLLVPYDSDALKTNQIQFKGKLSHKYIPAYAYINNRKLPTDPEYKYERACLLIVDFSTDPPTIINNVNQLVAKGVINQQFAANPKWQRWLNELSIDTFVEDIIKIYKIRHGNLDALS